MSPELRTKATSYRLDAPETSDMTTAAGTQGRARASATLDVANPYISLKTWADSAHGDAIGRVAMQYGQSAGVTSDVNHHVQHVTQYSDILGTGIQTIRNRRPIG